MKRLPSVFRLPQEKLVAKGVDVKNALLLSYINFWCERHKSKKVESNGEWFSRFHYPTILRDLPILGIRNKNALTPRIDKLHSLRLIDVHRKANNALYIRLTTSGQSLFDKASDNAHDASSMQNVCSEHGTPTVHETETALSNGHEQVFTEPRHGCPTKPRQNKEVNKHISCNKEEISATSGRAKEPEKDFSASADASAFSLSKDETDSANREKEDFGENGELPSQGNSFILPSLSTSNEYYARLNNRERWLFDFLVELIRKRLNRESTPSDLRYCRRVCYRSIRTGATYSFAPEMVEAGRLAC